MKSRKSSRLAGNEGSDGPLGASLSQHGTVIVEGLEEQDSLALQLVLGANVGAGADGELEVVLVRGSGEECLGRGLGLE